MFPENTDHTTAMRRALQTLFYILMVVAATLAGFMATDQTLTASSREILPKATGNLAMVFAGLAAGLCLAWIMRINWRAIPVQFRFWMQIQRSRFWWFTTAAASLSVLLFY